MDEITQIQLGESQHVNSINQDITIKMELSSSKESLMEYDVNSVVDVTQVFDNERQTTNIYRLHGKFEYLSLLNGLIPTYTKNEDFFARQSLTTITKTLLTDFKFYILKPIPESGVKLADGVTISSGYVELISDSRYIKNYEVISLSTNTEVFNAGFANNLFEEQQYGFILNADFNLTDVYDGLNFPLTELYLYAEYQPTIGKSNETISRKTYNSNGDTSGIEPFTATTLNLADIISGDIINYDKAQFTQTLYNRQEYTIRTDLSVNWLQWKYNPIIPITIRTLSDDLSRVNISGTSVIDIALKPDYATKIDDDGNYVWRNLLDIGFIDPLTGVGVNHPFINNRHYIFNNIIIPIVPDLDDSRTLSVFSSITFAANTFINSQPASNLNNIGESCLL